MPQSAWSLPLTPQLFIIQWEVNHQHIIQCVLLGDSNSHPNLHQNISETRLNRVFAQQHKICLCQSLMLIFRTTRVYPRVVQCTAAYEDSVLWWDPDCMVITEHYIFATRQKLRLRPPGIGLVLKTWQRNMLQPYFVQNPPTSRDIVLGPPRQLCTVTYPRQIRRLVLIFLKSKFIL